MLASPVSAAAAGLFLRTAPLGACTKGASDQLPPLDACLPVLFCAANAAYRLSFACFFGGVLITAALDAAVHALMHWAASRKQQRAGRTAGSSDCAASDSEAELMQSAPWSDGEEGCSAAHDIRIELQEGKVHSPSRGHDAVTDDVETGRAGGYGVSPSLRNFPINSGNGAAAVGPAPADAPFCNEKKIADSVSIAPGTVSPGLFLSPGQERSQQPLTPPCHSSLAAALLTKCSVPTLCRRPPPSWLQCCRGTSTPAISCRPRSEAVRRPQGFQYCCCWRSGVMQPTGDAPRASMLLTDSGTSMRTLKHCWLSTLMHSWPSAYFAPKQECSPPSSLRCTTCQRAWPALWGR